MEVRNRISVELLVTIESAKAKGNPLNSLSKSDEMIYDSGRVILFSKFLAEEWDLDFVALYLHNRDILQKHFNIRFRELTMQGIKTPEDLLDYPEKLREIVVTQQRVNEKHSAKALVSDPLILPPLVPSPLQQSKMMTLHRSTSTNSYLGEKNNQFQMSPPRKRNIKLKCLHALSDNKGKVVPIALPPQLYFAPCSALPEAPAVAFHIKTLPVCCEIVLPKCQSKLRKYVCNRIVVGVKKRLEAVAPVRPQSRGLLIDEQELLIPITTFLMLLCEEWRAMPAELREKFGSVGQAALSLEKLNDIYDHNCIAQKERLEEIRQTGILLSQSEAFLMTLEKQLRRSERRWKENRHHATDLELEALQNLRLQITEEMAKK